MILTRYIYKEIIYSIIRLLSILLLIFLSDRFIRYLSKASSGDIPSEFILQFLLIKSLIVLNVILPLAFFLSILLVLGRLYSENEMVAMASCGIGVPTIIKKILWLSLFVSILVGIFSLFLKPWAEQQELTLKIEAERLADIAGIAAGRFKGFAHGKGAFYVEKLAEDEHTMQSIFIAYDNKDKKILVSSKEGYQRIEPKTHTRFIVLNNGTRYEGSAGETEFTAINFAEHQVRIDQKARRQQGIDLETVATQDLWQSDDVAYLAELQLRISAPLAVILFAPLAVLMSYTTPRQGRFNKLFFAIIIYFIYINMLEISHKWVAQETIPVWLGVWWVHLTVFIAELIIFIRRKV
jgi:lipopolysaccharide export system permease protein